jgi:hypothetical protein
LEYLQEEGLQNPAEGDYSISKSLNSLGSSNSPTNPEFNEYPESGFSNDSYIHISPQEQFEEPRYSSVLNDFYNFFYSNNYSTVLLN